MTFVKKETPMVTEQRSTSPTPGRGSRVSDGYG
jgi:hypothetical protein